MVADLGGIVFDKVRMGGNMITNTHAETMHHAAFGDKVIDKWTVELRVQ